MAEIRTRHLFDMTLQVAGMQAIGATPNGNRRIGLVGSGTLRASGCVARCCRAAPTGSLLGPTG